MRNLALLMLCGLAVLSSVACRPKQQKLPLAFVDPYLETYIDAFVRDAATHGVIIPEQRLADLRIVKFVESVEREKQAYGQPSSGERLAGACTDVVIDNRNELQQIKGGKKKFWQEIWVSNNITSGTSTSPWVLKELMYHELGHCLLGRDHAALSPHRIMSPNVSGDADFLAKNWDQLLADLFESQKKLVAEGR